MRFRSLTILLLFVLKLFAGPASESSIDAVLKDSKGYLPTSYLSDGCDYRAYYISMDLASKELYSCHEYAYSQDGAFEPRENVEWSYHVAPRIRAGSSAMILDPSFSDSPISESVWLKGLNPKPFFENGDSKNALYRTTLYPPSTTFEGGVRQRELSEYSSRQAEIENLSLKEMPAFQISDINLALKTLHNYISKEELCDADKIAKRELLRRKTSMLVKSLDSIGKINWNEELSCSKISDSLVNGESFGATLRGEYLSGDIFSGGVASVESVSGGFAQKLGLEKGDILVSVGEKKMRYNPDEFIKEISSFNYSNDESLKLEFIRSGKLYKKSVLKSELFTY